MASLTCARWNLVTAIENMKTLHMIPTNCCTVPHRYANVVSERGRRNQCRVLASHTHAYVCVCVCMCVCVRARTHTNTPCTHAPGATGPQPIVITFVVVKRKILARCPTSRSGSVNTDSSVGKGAVPPDSTTATIGSASRTIMTR